MAYMDTQSSYEARQKAKALGATHYFEHHLPSGNIPCLYFVKGDQPDQEGNLLEVAHYVTAMNSFSELIRKQPFNQVGKKFYTHSLCQKRYEGRYSNLIENF